MEEQEPSTAVSVDLCFDDGSRLSERGIVDQHGVLVNPAAQQHSKTLLVDQWNLKRVVLAPVAGRRVVAVEVTVRPEGIPATGWIDAVAVAADKRPQPRELTDWVVTTRGTHSSAGFSCGNTAPLTAVPHGFNFLTPMTDAGSFRWIYSWHQHNDAENRPTLQAVALSHIPSPWMGDRSVFQVCPSAEPGTPPGDPSSRALPFDHADEIPRAHYYSLTTANGIRVEMTPTDHAAVLRFTFRDARGALVFDQTDGVGRLSLGAATERGLPVITGYVADARPGAASPPMYVYGVLDTAACDVAMLPQPGRADVCGYLRLDNAAGGTVELRLATSFVSVEQAARHLQQEAGDGVTFEQVARQAEDQWLDRLGTVQVEGASPDQLTTLYSNLYRLFLYPNSMTENLGTLTEPRDAYASSFRPPAQPHAADRTGCVVVQGRCSVNHGFWDTYRTCWPALTLLDPERAGGLLDGFVQQFRDGGWTARWSAPGYADCMVGTSTDIVFADAFLSQVPGVDYEAAYNSALRNATVPATDPTVGRKGLRTGLFAGYTATSTPEGLSWTLENAMSDHAISRWSAELARRAGPADPRRDEFEANAVYFGSRALSYAHMFDSRVGFFQGRDEDGSFRQEPHEYDPAVWGYDYVETNGWGMAFSAAHDGAGLAALYGGADALQQKLDAFFASPETAGDRMAGSYGSAIHEMAEARAVRMGMLGLSNQPAHHIPYMYLHTRAPHKTQAVVRECLRRLFVGSEIGQGYLGDEDNGEMSAWYLFGALGFYPLSPGSGEYVLTSPLFPRATVRLPGGKQLTITAAASAPEDVYIQSVTVNGEAWHLSAVPSELIRNGAVLDYVLGPEPSGWAAGPMQGPHSATPEGVAPSPLVDLTEPCSVRATSSHGDARVAFDNSSLDSLVLPPGGWVSYAFASAVSVTLYTVTASPDTAPQSWHVEGSTDGAIWSVLDTRANERYTWDRQTRAFLLPAGDRYPCLRLRIPPTADAERSAMLHQVEFLGARTLGPTSPIPAGPEGHDVR